MGREPLHLLLPQELFATAESIHFDGDYRIGAINRGVDVYEFREPVRYHIDITNTGGALLVAGEVEGEAASICGRCLEPFTMHVDAEVEGYYLIDAEVRDDEREDDEFEILPPDHKIDLAPLLDQAILLELPLVALCKADCLGLCPTCGKNLNEGACACAPVSDDAFQKANNPFSALKNLSFEE